MVGSFAKLDKKKTERDDDKGFSKKSEEIARDTKGSKKSEHRAAGRGHHRA